MAKVRPLVGSGAGVSTHGAEWVIEVSEGQRHFRRGLGTYIPGSSPLSFPGTLLGIRSGCQGGHPGGLCPSAGHLGLGTTASPCLIFSISHLEYQLSSGSPLCFLSPNPIQTTSNRGFKSRGWPCPLLFKCFQWLPHP